MLELVNDVAYRKKKRKYLEADVDRVWITKSNILRRTAKKKKTPKDVKDKIVDVVEELKTVVCSVPSLLREASFTVYGVLENMSLKVPQNSMNF